MKEKHHGRIKYAENLIRRVLENPDYYFSSGYLNSEGWKILGLIFKVLSREYPQLQRFSGKVREDPSYSNVARVLEDVLSLAKRFNSEEG